MAIFDHAECSVTINDKTVKEYDCPPVPDNLRVKKGSTSSRTMEKYIESKADQNFAIRLNLHKEFKFHDNFNTLRCDIFVDGRYKDNILLIAVNLSPEGTITRNLCGKTQFIDGKWELRKFRFSKLVEDAVHNSGIKMDFKQVGDIKVRITRANARLKPRTKIQNEKQISTPNFSEKSVKGRAVDNFTSLDSPVDVAASTVWEIVRTDTSIWTTFIFHYRSTETLQQLGIMEMPVSKRSLEDRDPATLTPEETLELVRRQKERLEQQEEMMRAVKKRLRQAEARHDVSNLNAMKRARSLTDDSGEVDDEVQIVKRPKNDANIEIVELD